MKSNVFCTYPLNARKSLEQILPKNFNPLQVNLTFIVTKMNRLLHDNARYMENASSRSSEWGELAEQRFIFIGLGKWNASGDILILNVVKKSVNLIGNLTTNLTECRMHTRSKFDRGKMLSHFNRGSWHTRFCGNRGSKRSPSSWQDITNTIQGYNFNYFLSERLKRFLSTNKQNQNQNLQMERKKQDQENKSIQVEEDIIKSDLEEENSKMTTNSNMD
ncbi:unnamed protein product [Mytilus coruscus]|uniref:Uncharacterized protein n=1 Tax=Mytilus coruscus TaxID=42192 RepID=A0A6J8A291_MYTCO|nr:unnamed protein product [Mytilus coruscus]